VKITVTEEHLTGKLLCDQQGTLHVPATMSGTMDGVKTTGEVGRRGHAIEQCECFSPRSVVNGRAHVTWRCRLGSVHSHVASPSLLSPLQVWMHGGAVLHHVLSVADAAAITKLLKDPNTAPGVRTFLATGVPASANGSVAVVSDVGELVSIQVWLGRCVRGALRAYCRVPWSMLLQGAVEPYFQQR
jgi:hypothetical protein